MKNAVFFSDGKKFYSKVRRTGEVNKNLTRLPDWLEPKNIRPDAIISRIHNVPSFLQLLMKLDGRKTSILLGSAFLLVFVGLINPLLIKFFLTEVERVGQLGGALGPALGFAGLIALTSAVHTTMLHHYFNLAFTIEIFLRNVLNRIVYARVFGLSVNALQTHSQGTLTNLIGSDTEELVEFPFILAESLYCILTIIMVTVAGWYLLGPSVLMGLVAILIFWPIGYWASKRFVAFNEAAIELRDSRVGFLTQIVSAVRLIKCMTWEKKVASEIDELRIKELAAKRKEVRAKSLALFVILLTETIGIGGTLAMFSYLGGELTVPLIFSAIALFERWEHPFANIPRYIQHIAKCYVSASRFISLLKEEGDLADQRVISVGNEKAPSISIRGLSARYKKDATAVLSDLNFEVNAGESIAVVGSLAAGKSSLLRALLGELETSGSIRISNSFVHRKTKLAYAPQRPIILGRSLKDNILFGCGEIPLDRYLRLTALGSDIAKMQDGIETQVGEEGITLSGGQKQRLALCRAAVRNPDLILLDDPISACDGPTGDLIIQRLVMGEWKSRTRVVATSRLEHLHLYDRVLFLEDGRISGIGTLDELKENHRRFSEFYSNAKINPELEGQKTIEATYEQACPSSKAITRCLSTPEFTGNESNENVLKSYIEAVCSNDSELSNSSWRFLSSKTMRLLTLVSLTLSVAFLPALQQIWLAWWADPSSIDINFLNDWRGSLRDEQMAMAIGYLATMFLMTVIYFVRFLYWGLRSLAASQILHRRALNSILPAPIRFFETNPSGRIVNRFSYDLDAVESDIPESLEQAMQSMAISVAMMIVTVAIAPWTLVALAILAVPAWRLQKGYRAVARDLKRIYSATRSPKFSHFKETLDALEQARAHSAGGWFWQNFDKAIGRNQRVLYNLFRVNRWFVINIAWQLSLLKFIGLCIAVYMVSQGSLAVGMVGVMSYALLLMIDHFQWSIRMGSDVESKLVSIERLLEYGRVETENLEEGEEVETSWPQQGNISFNAVSIGYEGTTEPILNSIDFNIRSRSVVGIVGRTGSGKSTIARSLFGMAKIFSGTIKIDGVEISKISKWSLRKSIALIPQDPVLLRGSVRSNISTQVDTADEDIWAALEKLGIKRLVKAMPKGLDTELVDGGHNLSQGQRQLLCMARALLTESKIIIMDEATANIDSETDQLIQACLHEAFADRTCLIIAHRLETLDRCDSIITVREGSATIKSKRHRSANLKLVEGTTFG